MTPSAPTRRWLGPLAAAALTAAFVGSLAAPAGAVFTGAAHTGTATGGSVSHLTPAAVAAVPAAVAAVPAAVDPAESIGLPPPIPTDGAYLGAWVDPGATKQTTEPDSTVSELDQLADFQAQIGRPLAIVHTYQSWLVHVQNQTLNALAATGAIPMIDWSCGDTDANIIAGNDDGMIEQFAEQLKQYGGPVFLRWYWEPNFKGSLNYENCIQKLGPRGYAEAFDTIVNLFRDVGATNVSFVWCPSVVNQQGLGAYYPGNNYVDWIGVDGYDRKQLGTGGFTNLFSKFYADWAPRGKPMLVGETGAVGGAGSAQAAYIEGIAKAMPASFPDIKALIYFDGSTHDSPDDDWTLLGSDSAGSSGLTAFADLGALPYFSVMP